jgi:dTDP-4-dehydrorhamnose 3,5-epimerase
MTFLETPLPNVWLIESELLQDERGYFTRFYCEEEYRARGLTSTFVQGSVSFNLRKGTLRGMHWQADPHGEAKLVRCTRGAIYDVVLDVRSESPTYGRWHAVHLSADAHRSVFVPVGCAHGYQTLTDATEVTYEISVPYVAGSARGIRWDDPKFGIRWPKCESRTLSARDSSFPDFDD